MKTKSVIIAVEDCVRRHHFSELVAQLPDFETVATTGCLMTTFVEVEDWQPHAVLISDCLAAQPEFEVMRALFSILDVRWLVVQSPEPGVAERLRKERRAAVSNLFSLGNAVSAAELGLSLRELTHFKRSRQTARVADYAGDFPQMSRVILLGASTGGIDALLEILGTFPVNCPPTLIVQHTGAGFGTSLRRLLSRQCGAEIVLADRAHSLRPGLVVIGAGTKQHLVLNPANGLSTKIGSAEPVSGHCPAVDALFSSALPIAHRVVAGVLTGMGRDGADGLLALRKAGATTMCQDQQSSVVFGMPRAAVERGAAEKILPLSEIGPALLAAARHKAASPKSAFT